MFPPKVLDIFSPEGGLGAFRVFSNDVFYPFYETISSLQSPYIRFVKVISVSEATGLPGSSDVTW